MDISLYRSVFGNHYLVNYIFRYIREQNEIKRCSGEIKKIKKYGDLRNVDKMLRKKNIYMPVFLDKCKRIRGTPGLNLFEELYFVRDSIKLICQHVNDQETFEWLYTQLDSMYFKGQLLKKVKALPKIEPVQFMTRINDPYTVDNSTVFSKCCESGSLEKCKFIYSQLESLKVESKDTIEISYYLQKIAESGNRDLIEWFIDTFSQYIHKKPIQWRLIIPHMVKYKWFDIVDVLTLNGKLENPLKDSLTLFRLQCQNNRLDMDLFRLILSKKENIKSSVVTDLANDIARISPGPKGSEERQNMVNLQIEAYQLLIKACAHNKYLNITSMDLLQRFLIQDNFEVFSSISDKFSSYYFTGADILDNACKNSLFDFIRFFIIEKNNRPYGNAINTNWKLEVVEFLYDLYKGANIQWSQFSIKTTSNQVVKFISTHSSNFFETFINNEYWNLKQYNMEFLKVIYQKSIDLGKSFLLPAIYTKLGTLTFDDIDWLYNIAQYKNEIYQQSFHLQLIKKRKHLLLEHLYSKSPFKLDLKMLESALMSGSLDTLKIVYKIYLQSEVPTSSVSQKLTFEKGTLARHIPIESFLFLKSKGFIMSFRTPCIKEAISKHNLPLFLFIYKNQPNIITNDIAHYSMHSFSIFKWIFENRVEGGDLKTLQIQAQKLVSPSQPDIIRYLQSMSNYQRSNKL
ncbi:hypothetical protein DLAC_01029 [Tieghemostelium lacteum]|uniref:Uncharacterized protein n=1 Tax=Tieghemostelium lacteum TaxID=361077 RepID=A0A152A7J8_TIELA|nr:hypothetical protein DLAC_01029 [Tieghemostelium lacteum]|eukprot:KYR02209.1 hypothetical protein DLAC_01029 [Tieghemostelium lacteum]